MFINVTSQVGRPHFTWRGTAFWQNETSLKKNINKLQKLPFWVMRPSSSSK